MQIVSLLVILLAFHQVDCGIKRFSCNATGKTFTKPLCKLSLVSRNLTTVSLGGEFVKEVDKVFVLFTWFYKTGSNWRRLFQSPSFEFCGSILKDNKMPFFEGFLENVRKAYPTLPFKCPIKPGPYYMYNVTRPENNGMVPLGNSSATTFYPLPNGIYKYSLKLGFNQDPGGAFYEWLVEVKARLNDHNF